MNNFSKIKKKCYFFPKFHLKPNGAGSLFHGTLVSLYLLILHGGTKYPSTPHSSTMIRAITILFVDTIPVRLVADPLWPVLDG